MTSAALGGPASSARLDRRRLTGPALDHLQPEPLGSTGMGHMSYGCDTAQGRDVVLTIVPREIATDCTAACVASASARGFRNE